MEEYMRSFSITKPHEHKRVFGPLKKNPSELIFHVYLSHMNELGEDLGSLLGCVSAEDHQLDPLGDSVTHHD